MDNIKVSKIPTGKTKGVLFVLLDAFRWDYLTPEDAPTIFALSQRSIYIKKLISSSGFTQRSAMFTGALSDTHGNYTMYVRDPKTSPFKMLRPFVPILRLLRQNSFIYRFSRKVINQIPKLSTEWAPPGRIPSEILPHISVIEDRTPIDQAGTLPLETVFDKMRQANIEYRYYMAPVSGHDEPTMQKVLEEIQKGGQVFFVQFSDTDGLVHRDGVDSKTRHRVVREVDERVRILKEAMEKRFENPWIIVCGDHGMVDVEQYIDVWSKVENKAKELCLVHGKDYLMFLDSTLARFWFFTNKARDILSPYLDTALADHGEWINADYRAMRHIADNPTWYGERIWKANHRVGIYPDYFHGHNDRYVGMHGYDCMEDPMKGLAVIANAEMSKQITLEEGGLESLCASLCDILEMPVPDTATGVSFIPKT